ESSRGTSRGAGAHPASASASAKTITPRAITARCLELHLQNVESADDAVHGVHDALLVDVDVVDLDRLRRRLLRRVGHEVRGLLRMERIAPVECAQPAVEERPEHEVFRDPAARTILVEVVRAEAPVALLRVLLH